MRQQLIDKMIENGFEVLATTQDGITAMVNPNAEMIANVGQIEYQRWSYVPVEFVSGTIVLNKRFESANEFKMDNIVSDFDFIRAKKQHENKCVHVIGAHYDLGNGRIISYVGGKHILPKDLIKSFSAFVEYEEAMLESLKAARETYEKYLPEALAKVNIKK